MKPFVAITAMIAAFAAAINIANAQGKGSFDILGSTGVTAMHAVVTGPRKIVIVDKAEKGQIKNPDGSFAWAAEYDYISRKFRPLKLKLDSFCSAGAFLGNGTLVGAGGGTGGIAPSGYQSVRMFTPCNDGSCQWIEKPPMKTARWYNTMVTLPNGKILNVGGSITGTSSNTAAANNPTTEIFPDDLGKDPRPFQFLKETLPYNLYPTVFVLPHTKDTAFVFANRDAINWNWVTNKVVKKFPSMPGPPRGYPLTGTAVLLPLTVAKNFAPEILICGGQAIHSGTNPADNSCGRIAPEGAGTWEMDTFGGIRRVMPDGVVMPNGNVLFLNGASVGMAGYKNVASQPARTALMYSPSRAKGNRWARMATSTIPRLYHSVALLTPDAHVWVAGSNPHASVTKGGPFPTEFRAELYTPTYFALKVAQAKIVGLDAFSSINSSPYKVHYGRSLKITVSVADSNPSFRVVIMKLAFVTHSTSMNQRYTEMRISKTGREGKNWVVTATLPPNGQMHPPGPSYIFVENKGKPSGGAHVLLN